MFGFTPYLQNMLTQVGTNTAGTLAGDLIGSTYEMSPDEYFDENDRAAVMEQGGYANIPNLGRTLAVAGLGGGGGGGRGAAAMQYANSGMGAGQGMGLPSLMNMAMSGGQLKRQAIPVEYGQTLMGNQPFQGLMRY